MLRCFCHHSFYQIKLLNTLPCINLLTPHLFLNVLMEVAQILVMCTDRVECYGERERETRYLQHLMTPINGQ